MPDLPDQSGVPRSLDVALEREAPENFLTQAPHLALRLATQRAGNRVLNVFENELPGYFAPFGIRPRLTRNGTTVIAGNIPNLETVVFTGALKLGEGVQKDRRHFTVFGGACLTGLMEVVTTDNRGAVLHISLPPLSPEGIIQGVQSTTDNHPYPHEYMARIGRTMVSTVQYLQSEYPRASVSPMVHVPREEYITRAERLYREKRMTLPAVREYWEIIAEKSQRMEAGFRAMFDQFGLPEPEFLNPLARSFKDIKPGEFADRNARNNRSLDMHQSTPDTAAAFESYLNGIHTASRRAGGHVFIEDPLSLLYYREARENFPVSGVIVVPTPLFYRSGEGPYFRDSPLLETERARVITPWYE